jgi:hypothetical protein
MAYSCNDKVVIGGFLATANHTGPVILEKNKESGVLHVIISHYSLGEPLKYCVVVATGEASAHHCGPAIVVSSQ